MSSVASPVQPNRQDRSSPNDAMVESLSRFILRVLNEEVETYIQRHAEERDASGHALVTRNGRGAPRTLHLVNGSLTLRAPRVNDRRLSAEGRRIRFTSAFLRPYVRRGNLLSKQLPEQYRAGLETGDFAAVLATVATLTGDAVSADSVVRLTAFLQREHEAFSRFAR